MTSPGGISKQARQRRDRSRRVVLLIVGIVLLSLGDLVITLILLKSTGMAEANPIASYLIRSTGSGFVLAAYKALTVGVCVSLLYRLRPSVEGEVAAWCAMAVLALTAVQWYQYMHELDDLDQMELAHCTACVDQWLLLE